MSSNSSLLSIASGNSSSTSSVGTPGSGNSLKSKSPRPAAKPLNVFSDDGSFLDRIRRSMKEEDDKKKEKEALKRKLHFEDRFKNRGKKRVQSQDPEAQTSTSEDTSNQVEVAPPKKPRLSVDGPNGIDWKEDKPESLDHSAQAEYHKVMDSYPASLKDSGTGVRSLVK